MALKLLNLNSSAPHTTASYCATCGVDGQVMRAHDLTRRVNRGALYAQVEELGARVEDLADDDFDFDEEDWDSL